MISFFRKALSSWLVLGLLALVMLAFIVTGVGGSDLGGQPAGGGDTLATVGKRRIGSTEMEQRVQSAVRQQQQQQQGLTMAGFIAGGGFEQVLEQVVAGTALEEFGRRQGFAAGKRLVDGEIASIPGFRGPTGQFDEGAMRAALAQQGIAERQLRDDIAGDAIRRQLLVPVAAAARAPTGLVLPYASLLLETRRGLIGVVPASVLAGGPAPTEAELTAWYDRRRTAYVVPERRVLRYAVVGREQVAAVTVPSEAEIAAAYKAGAARYAATERRDVTQLVLDSQAKAAAFAAALARGTPFARAAAEMRLTPTTLAGKTRAELAELASPAVADALFVAPQGAVTAPARSDFGWHVARVDAVTRTAGRTLPQVRGEIAAALGAEKAKQALADLAGRIDDALGGGASFDEVARAEKLAVATTPALLRTGGAPDQPGWAAPSDVAPLLAQAFQMDADDDPVIATIVPNERFALLGVARVQPAAAPPLAAIRARVAADLVAERAQQRAKALAEAIRARVAGGATLAAAFAAAPVRLPAPALAGGRRVDLGRAGATVPPPLATMFGMAPGGTKLVELPGRQGWWVVQLVAVAPGDARAAPALVDATRSQFSGVIGEEYAQQFAAATRAALGVKTDAAAIARLKGRLAGAQ